MLAHGDGLRIGEELAGEGSHGQATESVRERQRSNETCSCCDAVGPRSVWVVAALAGPTSAGLPQWRGRDSQTCWIVTGLCYDRRCDVEREPSLCFDDGGDGLRCAGHSVERIYVSLQWCCHGTARAKFVSLAVGSDI